MKRGPHIALAVGFGYLMGRRRRLTTALALGAAAVSSRIDSMSARLRNHSEALRQPVRPEEGRPGEDWPGEDWPGEEEDVQRPRRSARAEDPDEDEFEEPYEEDEEARPTSTRTPRPRQTTGTRGAGRRGGRLRDLRGGTRRGRAGGPRSPARPASAGALIESGHPPRREVIT